MKILVTVKQVPDTSGKVAVNPDGTLDRASMQTIINPDDLNAVEAALALKDELGCKVIAFTMGPPPAEGMLRELMAMGVDEGVLVTAREFGGSDTFATSQIIAAGIKGMSIRNSFTCNCREGICRKCYGNLYYINRDKSMYLAVIGEDSIEKGIAEIEGKRPVYAKEYISIL